MTAKKKGKPSTKVVVEKAMPGWTVAGTSAKDAKKAAKQAAADTSELDAVSPSLATMRAKASGKDMKPVKFAALKKHHAEFVRVKPAAAMDADGSQEKVVLVRDGKVVARQG